MVVIFIRRLKKYIMQSKAVHDSTALIPQITQKSKITNCLRLELNSTLAQTLRWTNLLRPPLSPLWAIKNLQKSNINDS